MKKAELGRRDEQSPPPNKKHHESKTLHGPGSNRSAPLSDPPIKANFDSSHLTIGAGVAIFHIASSCVIVCRHSAKKYWFLPKGRRDAGEDTARGAEREGFEEVSFPPFAHPKHLNNSAMLKLRACSLATATGFFPSRSLTANRSRTTLLLPIRPLYASLSGRSWSPSLTRCSTCSSGTLPRPCRRTSKHRFAARRRRNRPRRPTKHLHRIRMA